MLQFLPCMSKIIEKVDHRRQYTFCEMQGLLINKQFGNHRKCSTIEVVPNVVANILSDMENNNKGTTGSPRRFMQLTIIYYFNKLTALWC